jgi:hypothetical protein
MPVTRIQIRRGTAADWASVNPTLAVGEYGLETDTGKLKLGNGIQNWNQLEYVRPSPHSGTHATGGLDAIAPSGIGAAGQSVTEVFASSGNWTKPANAKSVHVVCIGAGGGGGSGRASAVGTAAGGAGGGMGGSRSMVTLSASLLAATESVTVGAGGDGAASAALGTNGGTGVSGGTSLLGSWVTASGGVGGAGGSDTAGGIGGSLALPRGIFPASSGGSASNTFGVGTPASPSSGAATGGGAGGGVTAAGAVSSGTGSNPPLATPNANSTGVSGDGFAAPLASPLCGGGGGGGNSSVTSAGSIGGNGGRYGGGGGGGGAAAGFASGAGGTGAAGIVIVTTYF